MRTRPTLSLPAVVAGIIPRTVPARRQVLAVLLLFPIAGCMVGPDFAAPTPPLADKWLKSGDPTVKTDHQDYENWWTAFHDPTLDRLIRIAYDQNLTLLAAGTRVLEARAALGVAAGEFYPQTQQIGANVSYNQASQVDPTSNPLHTLGNYWRGSLGTQVAWELDLWGKFRRGVESADATYLASIATYDDVLVTLLGDVATSYIGIRTLQQQIEIARENVVKQQKALAIARDRFHGGTATGLDVFQAENVLAQTEATIPQTDGSAGTRGECPARAAGHDAGIARHPACGLVRHTGSAGRCRCRHSRRSGPPPAGHSQRRARRRRPKCPDRHRQGRSVSGLQPDRRVWHRGRHDRQQPPERGLHCQRHPIRLRSHVQLAGSQLWPDHQQRPGAGCAVAGLC